MICGAFKKVVCAGCSDCGAVWVEIEWDGRRLSLSGVEGPRQNGDCKGRCGQIVEAVENTQPPASWAARLCEIWRRWHLNDMRAGCAHQRAAGWDKRPIDPAKPLDSYGKHFEGQQTASWNMLVWIFRSEHPEGLLNEPCPECGHKYGSAWLFEPVPPDVVCFLRDLPDESDKYPWGNR